jgi:hypothetical protein
MQFVILSGVEGCLIFSYSPFGGACLYGESSSHLQTGGGQKGGFLTICGRILVACCACPPPIGVRSRSTCRLGRPHPKSLSPGEGHKRGESGVIWLHIHHISHSEPEKESPDMAGFWENTSLAVKASTPLSLTGCKPVTTWSLYTQYTHIPVPNPGRNSLRFFP